MSNARSARPSPSTTVGITTTASFANLQPDGCTIHATRRLRMDVRREIVLPTTPERAWEALTEPSRLEEWFATEVELALREGGAAVFRWGDGDTRHAEVVTVEDEERLLLRVSGARDSELPPRRT